MSASAAFGGGVYIADSSVWPKSGHPRVRDAWASALRAGQITTCSIVRLELLYSARDLVSFDAIARSLLALRDIPVSASVQRAAVTAMRELAATAPLHHRVPLADLLIAAAAQEAGVGVLHHDRHYDRLAQVLSFESRWLAPAGELT